MSEIKIKVVLKPVKNFRITVKETGEVILVAPYLSSEREIKKLVDEKWDWIKKNVRLAEENERLKKSVEGVLYLGGEYTFVYDKSLKKDFSIIGNEIHSGLNLADGEVLEKFYKERAREEFEFLVDKYSAIMGVCPEKIFIRSAKTKWGCCTSNGNVSFNYKLVKAPINIAEYVVVHELSHLRYMSHDKNFWGEVERFMPDYKKRRAELKKLTPVLQ